MWMCTLLQNAITATEITFQTTRNIGTVL